MDARKRLEQEQQIPQTGEWNGLLVGPNRDVIISGDPLDLFPTTTKGISPTIPFFLAPTGGQRKVKGDHPDTLGDPRINEQKKSFK